MNNIYTKNIKPNNIGIIDIEIYFPRYYISQSELEKYYNIPEHKYTIGLGQTSMSFIDDNEDINSLCLTVFHKLLSNNNINPKLISRIEIGSETIIDKSKSIKTHIMDLIQNINNDIEGTTVFNACYGGTSAIINTINYMNSIYYDSNKYCIVICGDVAVYNEGPALPTGGAGVVGILFGSKNVEINFGFVRASYFENQYDFYKPNMSSEYPIVDGKESLKCYLKSLYECLKRFKEKKGKNYCENEDFFAFHCPYCKLVEKAFLQVKIFYLCFDENNNYKIDSNLLRKIKNVDGKFWELEKNVQNEIKNVFINEFNSKIFPGLFLCKNLGNLYTASLYAFLLSLILNNDKLNIINKKIFMFSYGSGLASTLFTLKIKSLKNILKNNQNVFELLNKRKKISIVEYVNIMKKREKLYLKNNYVPSGKNDDLFEETFFLKKVD